jgi:competence protein ComEC
MVATHAHMDHIGGLPSLASALPVKEAWDAGQDEVSVPQQQLLASWLTLGVPWRGPSANQQWEADGVRVEVLGPLRPKETVNDGSLVLKVTHGRFTAVLAGDLEAEGEAWLHKRYPDLRADVLKVGHHGSRGATSAEWLQGLKPRLAIISVGARNVFGHPHPQTLGRLWRAGALVRRTDRDGAILVRSNARGWNFATRSDAWRKWWHPQ